MPTGRETKIVTARFGNEDAKTLAGYEKTGGYQVLRKALGMTSGCVGVVLSHLCFARVGHPSFRRRSVPIGCRQGQRTVTEGACCDSRQ